MDRCFRFKHGKANNVRKILNISNGINVTLSVFGKNENWAWRCRWRDLLSEDLRFQRKSGLNIWDLTTWFQFFYSKDLRFECALWSVICPSLKSAYTAARYRTVMHWMCACCRLVAFTTSLVTVSYRFIESCELQMDCRSTPTRPVNPPLAFSRTRHFPHNDIVDRLVIRPTCTKV